MKYEPVVFIRPNAGPFVFNTDDRGTDEALTEASAFAEEMRSVVQRWLPWNQVAMGPFAWVELREMVGEGTDAVLRGSATCVKHGEYVVDSTLVGCPDCAAEVLANEDDPQDEESP